MIRAIVQNPQEAPQPFDISGDTLSALQERVGGLIEGVYIPGFDERGISCYANEEGLLLQLAPNLLLGGQPIVGPVVFVGHNDEGETVSLTPEQEARVIVLLGMVSLHRDAADHVAEQIARFL